ncbi:hypothetical protein ACQP2X_15435 [Actinoplanes sp. CA-131856]
MRNNSILDSATVTLDKTQESALPDKSGPNHRPDRPDSHSLDSQLRPRLNLASRLDLDWRSRLNLDPLRRRSFAPLRSLHLGPPRRGPDPLCHLDLD